jgi:hypothetical protein
MEGKIGLVFFINVGVEGGEAAVPMAACDVLRRVTFSYMPTAAPARGRRHFVAVRG